MKLTDSVEIMTGSGTSLGTLRAHVGYVAILKRSKETGAVMPQEELRVMVPPDPRAENTANHVKWRGKTYRIQGEVQIYRRNGRDHHFTITLGDTLA